MCARKLVNGDLSGRIMQIFTDIQTSIKALENPKPTSQLVKEAKYPLNALVSRNRVTITQVTGHSGYKGNKRTGKIDKQGADLSGQPGREVGLLFQEGCNAIIHNLRKEKWET